MTVLWRRSVPKSSGRLLDTPTHSMCVGAERVLLVIHIRINSEAPSPSPKSRLDSSRYQGVRHDQSRNVGTSVERYVDRYVKEPLGRGRCEEGDLWSMSSPRFSFIRWSEVRGDGPQGSLGALETHSPQKPSAKTNE